MCNFIEFVWLGCEKHSQFYPKNGQKKQSFFDLLTNCSYDSNESESEGKRLKPTPLPHMRLWLKQPISMSLQIGNVACVLRTVSDRDAFEEIYYLYFFKPVHHCSYFLTCFYRSTGLVAGMGSLLIFIHDI